MVKHTPTGVLAACLFTAPAIYANTASNQQYTAFIGPTPSLTKTVNGLTYYQTLLQQLKTGKPYAIDRIVVMANTPTSDASTYGVGTSVANSGAMVKNLLSQVKAANPNVQVYLMPTIEAGTTDWQNWNGWQNSTIPSCEQVNKLADGSPTRMVTKSVCWADEIASLLPGVINGIAYDGQKFMLGNKPETVAPIVHTTGDPIQTLGWISGGYKPGADMNFIEVYDLNKGSNGSHRIDTVTPDKAYTYAGQATMFPTQQIAATVNSSIYSCAIGDSNCRINGHNQGNTTLYSNVVDSSDTPANQMIESWNYIFHLKLKDKNDFCYPAGIPKMNANNTVFVFSTQYKGPVGSDGTTDQTKSQCIGAQFGEGNCGDENGFGSWYTPNNAFNPLQQFEQATSTFVAGACRGTTGSNCDASKMAGVWQWDFTPSSWTHLSA